MRTVLCRTCSKGQENFKDGVSIVLVLGLCFRICGSGFRVSGFKLLVRRHLETAFGVQVSGFRVRGFGFRVSGLGFRVSGFGFRVSDFGLQTAGWSSPGEGVVVWGC